MFSITTAPTVVQEAVRYLSLRYPEFATPLFEPGVLQITKPDGTWMGIDVPTACCTKRCIVLNPDFLEKLGSFRFGAYVIAHEIMHRLRLDPLRSEAYYRNGLGGQPFNNPLAQVCADIVINHILDISGVAQRPQDTGIDPLKTIQEFNKEFGLTLTLDPTTTWESLYLAILPHLPPRGSGGQGQGDGEGEGDGNGMPCSGKPFDDFNGNGQATEGEGGEATEMGLKMMAKQMADVARQAGRGASALVMSIDALLKPKIDWRSVMASFVQMSAAAGDQTNWARARKKLLVSHGVYYPRTQSEVAPPVAIGLDTSGSMFTEDQIQLLLSEACGIVQDAGVKEVYIMACDTQIGAKWHIKFDDGTPPTDAMAKVAKEVVGGGGTTFDPPFIEAAQFEDKLETATEFCCMVYFTDGYPAGWPDEKLAKWPTLWCITTDVVAPWGQTVKLEMD